MKHLVRILAFGMLALALSGCEQLGSTEYAVRFWNLPRPLGGLSSRIYRPGETIVKIPLVTELHRFDASVQDVSWGSSPDGEALQSRYVQTRALDGNEVALAVTISYRVSVNPDEPDTLQRIVREVGASNEAIEALVAAAARSDLRTYMNELKTSEFIDKSTRYKAVDEVRDRLAKRLNEYGIEIHRVILDDFEFRRERPDGTFDTSYEDLLKQIQQTEEDILRERDRIGTVRAQKQQELAATQSKVNQMEEEAKGFREQARRRGDAYLAAKQAEADGIRVAGTQYVEGLQQQIEALSGPGGKAILKLELARQLIEHAPSFVVFNADGQDGVVVNRMDANELLQQLGVLEGLKSKSSRDSSTITTPVAEPLLVEKQVPEQAQERSEAKE